MKELEAKQRQNTERARSDRRARGALARNDQQESHTHPERSHANDDATARESGDQQQQLTSKV
jgi:hypothetical protein